MRLKMHDIYNNLKSKGATIYGINTVKFIPSIIHSKFQEMLRFENSNSRKVSEKTIINSKELKY
jgi:hypothetical protein